MRVAVVFLSITLPSIASSIAWAGEDELILAIEPGYGLLLAPQGAPDSVAHGGAGSIAAWLGVTDTIFLAASGGAATGFSDGPTIGEALGGVVLALDVLRVVPYGEALIGAIITPDSVGASYRLGLGADYLLSKTFSLGLVARYRGLADNLGGDGLFTAQLRFALRLEL